MSVYNKSLTRDEQLDNSSNFCTPPVFKAQSGWSYRNFLTAFSS